jgi:hypothetical protein
MPTFVVECYWPGMLEEDARTILDRVIQFAGEASPGRSVGSLGCVLVPGDGMALFLLTAPASSSLSLSDSASSPPEAQGAAVHAAATTRSTYHAYRWCLQMDL